MWDFLFDLVVDPKCSGLPDIYGKCQCDGAYRFDRNQLDALALEWASEESLPWPDRVTLLLRLDNLPWDRDEIAFHWGYAD